MRKKSTGDSAFKSDATPGLPVKGIGPDLVDAEEELSDAGAEEEEEDGEEQGADGELPWAGAVEEEVLPPAGAVEEEQP